MGCSLNAIDDTIFDNQPIFSEVSP